MNTDKNNTQLPQSSVSVSAFLNGKAKQDFEVFQIHRSLAITNADRLENYKLDFKDLEPYSHHIWRMDKVYLNALIVEWFDSIGINITIGIDVNNSANDCEQGCGNCEKCFDTWNPEYEYCIYVFTEIKNNINDYSTSFSENNFQSRKDALETAIQKANELYNEKVVEAEH